MADWRWWGEQVAHGLAGAAIVALFRGPEAMLGAALGDWFTQLALTIAIVAGALREIIQNHDDVGGSLGDSIADFLFWTLGAILMSVVF